MPSTRTHLFAYALFILLLGTALGSYGYLIGQPLTAMTGFLHFQLIGLAMIGISHLVPEV